MPGRLRSLRNPVEFRHDGEAVVAEAGEPIAFALIAEGRLPIARSPKLHRPRGPYCLRGGCDGCLARVNGSPDVMTCLRRAVGGERVETQNVVGSRSVDMLRAADFLFPKGIDHHRLFAGVRGVSGVVQSFARRVAGLGKLPDTTLAPRKAEHRLLDVLVVGGGASGLTLARELGNRAVLVDDGPALGGTCKGLDPVRAAQLVEEARASGAELRAETTIVGLFREPERADRRLHALAVGPQGATLFVPRVTVLATGRHDAVLAFGENDLPGIYSARAALGLFAAGIGLGARVVLVGSGRAGAAFVEKTAGSIEVVSVAESELVRAMGRSRVSRVVVKREHELEIRADAVVVDGPGSPASELAIQAGGEVDYDALEGYRLRRDDDGRVGAGLYALGSLTGAGAGRVDVAATARALLRALG